MWVCKCPPSLWISLILGWISWILEDSYSTSFTGEFRPFPFKITIERDLLNSVILAIVFWLVRWFTRPHPTVCWDTVLHTQSPPCLPHSPSLQQEHISQTVMPTGDQYGFPFYPKAIGYQPEGRKGLEADEAGFIWPCVWTEWPWRLLQWDKSILLFQG